MKVLRGAAAPFRTEDNAEEAEFVLETSGSAGAAAIAPAKHESEGVIEADFALHALPASSLVDLISEPCERTRV